jgi:hypothetical protein
MTKISDSLSNGKSPRVKLPLLNIRSKTNEYPSGRNPVCPVCGAVLKETGTAWCKMESKLYDKKMNEVKMELPHGAIFGSEMSITFHGSEMMDSPFKYKGELLHSSTLRDRGEKLCEGYKSENIVERAKFNNVKFKFCSVKCMKKFFNNIFDDFVEEFRDEYGYDP